MSNEESIFAEARLRPGPDERRRYLDDACRDDAALRRRVEALLEAHRDDEFLGAPAVGISDISHQRDAIAPTIDVPRPPIAEGPGTRIGPYKLLQKIGEGGMGVVFMAEQETPVRRKVALKVIKPAKKNLSEAAERVVRLYGSWAKPEKAAEWMAKLAADLPRGPDHGFPAAPFALP